MDPAHKPSITTRPTMAYRRSRPPEILSRRHAAQILHVATRRTLHPQYRRSAGQRTRPHQELITHLPYPKRTSTGPPSTWHPPSPGPSTTRPSPNMEGSKRFDTIRLDSFAAFFQRSGATRTGSGRAAGGGAYHDTPGAGRLG